MAQDPLFGERIEWSGYPETVSTPPLFTIAAAVLFVTAAVSTLFALVTALALQLSPAATLLFGAWATTLGIACLQGPRLWLSGVRYTVTENHVIYQRGAYRRSIERRSVSFARIFWSRTHPGMGDLELVRAVPTGALHRRLVLRMPGLAAPDRVWAIIRGAEHVSPRGTGERPLTQRLDAGERVLWAARPRSAWRAFRPHGRREWMQLAIAAVLLAVFARTVLESVPNLEHLARAGLPIRSAAFLALVLGIALSAGLVLATASWLIFDAVVRPGRLARETRYLVTNRRVLIQRGVEELHLDRARIVDVIDAPSGDGLRTVFLVLDGPRARALAPSGAFGEGERGPELRPVFESVEDAESVSRILRSEPDDTPSLPRAA
ncbi:MAG: hypothetical protein OZ921_18370 [Sorangiineae bacterium]|nr:hypothetical protein [Polyangiaceae bacterium]MEB2324486.1 hypothetical protein [Sorangiineae bacterium]